MADALLDAVKEGDLEKLKRLIVEGALSEAAFFGHIPIMHWLLTEGGSSLTEKDIHGTRALMITAFLRCSICWRSEEL
jgi:hypothetical protein